MTAHEHETNSVLNLDMRYLECGGGAVTRRHRFGCLSW